jgi:phosphoribosylaminoimidazolecarboxamide formyltransferase / IMP cyclohydrolase
MPERITHALISVSDKTGLVEFAKALVKANITLLSTSGSATLLKEHQIPVTDVSDFTGFPEMMGGRVKTLHPKLYAGIMARGAVDDDSLRHHRIPVIGLVVVNLYPFAQTIAQADCTLEKAIENIDIGGPSLLRAAAKNFNYTTAIVSNEDYDSVINEISMQGGTLKETRLELAKKVFAHVTAYDAAISHYFSTIKSSEKTPFPQIYTLQLHKKLDLRYGENPHQQAAFYVEDKKQGENSDDLCQQSGKPLSYNNMVDADTALECVRQFNKTACVIVKHANPCGVALGDTQLQAYQKAFKADPISAFGGIIAFNTSLDLATFQEILSNQFVEVIIAPAISKEVLEISQEKPNIRLLTVASLKNLSEVPKKRIEFKSIEGGILVQDRDNLPSPPKLEVVTVKQPTYEQLEDLFFAWRVIRFIKSNAIVYAKAQSTLGIGAGQMSRIFSSKIAALKAEEAQLSLQNAVMASDAFFPFRDSIDEAAAQGIVAIIQPGGAIRDKEIIEVANDYNLVMVFTHIRHFRH